MNADRLGVEICLREAWPASEVEELCGWRLRATNGGFARTNSVWTGVFTGEVPVGEAIEQAEAFYRKHNLKPSFQMLEGGEPTDLDALLERRGYAREAPASVLAKPVQAVAMPPEVMFANLPTPDWLEAFVDQLDAARGVECRYILIRVPVSRTYLLLREAGAPVSLALAVRRGPDVSVDCVLTRPEHRRAGGATTIMQAAEAWAHGQGANRLVLSLPNGNAPARALFDKLGYAPHSAHYYRTLLRG